MARCFSLIFIAMAIVITGAKAGAVENQADDGTAMVTRADEKQAIHLYFADPLGRHLISEERFFPVHEDVGRFGKVLLNALVEGPKGTLHRTLPEGIGIRAFFLIDDGTAVADIRLGGKRLSLSCREEVLAVFSIVNTLIVNIPEIRQVKIITQGTGAVTFAGHVDITDPLKADMLLIR